MMGVARLLHHQAALPRGWLLGRGQAAAPAGACAARWGAMMRRIKIVRRGLKPELAIRDEDLGLAPGCRRVALMKAAETVLATSRREVEEAA